MNIIEFARAIGVSTATVSRAMNNRGRISEETRRYVLSKVEELDFVPNVNAQQLVTRRNRVVGLDHPANPDLLSDFYLVELARGIQEALRAEGYGLMLHLGGSREESTHWSRGKRVEGLIVVLSSETPQEIRHLKKKWKAPAVFIGNEASFDDEACSRVLLDLKPGACQAMRHLIEMGHRKIAFLGSLPCCQVKDIWSNMMQAAGLAVSKEYEMIAGTAAEAGIRGAERLLSLPEPPTAILARTDVLAMGSLRAVRLRGKRIPEDIAVIGHDDIALAALCDPPLTTVRIDKHLAGTLAARLLFEHLRDPEAPGRTLTVSSHLVVRESCGAVDKEVIAIR